MSFITPSQRHLCLLSTSREVEDSFCVCAHGKKYSLSCVSGRKLFGKAGNQLQSKSLKQLEEDRETWRKREEAKLQVEKEEILRKQQEEQRRAEMVNHPFP